MQIMVKKTNYVMLLLCKMTLCLNPLWTSRFKVILRRKGWYSSTWKGSCRSNMCDRHDSYYFCIYNYE